MTFNVSHSEEPVRIKLSGMVNCSKDDIVFQFMT